MTPTTHNQVDPLEEFTAYFVRNYPGPDTIINDPHWHAPKIFSAALQALRAELTHPQEVAAVADEDGIVWPVPAMTTPSPNLAEYFSAPQVRAMIAASRAPEVVRAEPVTDAEVHAARQVLGYKAGQVRKMLEGFLLSRTAPQSTAPLSGNGMPLTPNFIAAVRRIAVQSAAAQPKDTAPVPVAVGEIPDANTFCDAQSPPWAVTDEWARGWNKCRARFTPPGGAGGEVGAAQVVIDELNETLNRIGDFAHDRSKGPAIHDDLWEVRRMAYEGQIEFDATPPRGAGGSVGAIRNAAIEECAALLDADADRQEDGWNEHLKSSKGGPATSFHTIPRGYAESLRRLKSATPAAEQSEWPEIFCECANCANGMGKCQTAAEQGKGKDAERLRTALQDLIRGYVRLIEAGRDIIVMRGGQCDPVEKLEATDPCLRAARAAILASKPAAGEVGHGQ